MGAPEGFSYVGPGGFLSLEGSYGDLGHAVTTFERASSPKRARTAMSTDAMEP